MTELSSPAAPRFQRVGRLGGAILVLALVLWTGAGLYLHSDDAAERARVLVETEGGRLLGERLSIERLSLTSVLPPVLEIEGVSVESAVGAQSLFTLSAARLSLSKTPMPWTEVIEVRSVELDSPMLRMDWGADGAQDFRGLFDLLAASKGKEGGLQLQLGALDVRGASLRLSLQSQDVDLTLRGMDLSWALDRAGDGAGQLGINTIELRAGDVRERGELKPSSFHIKSDVVRLDPTRFNLLATTLTLDGELRLPSAPASGRAQPLSHALRVRGDVELPRLAKVLPSAPDLEGDLAFVLGLHNEGDGLKTSFSLQGQEVRVKMARSGKTFNIENPSLIGTLAGGRLELNSESVCEWGGGRVRPTGWLNLKDDFDFELELGLEHLQLGKSLDSSTVKRPWINMDVHGVASLVGQAKGGISARGSLGAEIRDLVVTSGPWDAQPAAKRVLYVPRARLDSGISLTSKQLALAPARLKGPGSDLEVSTTFLFGRPMGLEIDVRGKTFDMDDISNRIAGVKLEGEGSIEARIAGPGNDLDITGRLEMEDFKLGKWPFGRVAGKAHYHARGDLEFTSLRGRRGKSDFESEVRLHFPDIARGGERDELELSIDAVIPRGHGQAEDLLAIFFGGSLGAEGPIWGNATLSGPPKELSGSAKILGESISYLWEDFERVALEAQVREGVLHIEQGIAAKPSGRTLEGRGWISPGGDIDFRFDLERMMLSEMAPIRDRFGGRSSSLVELAGGGGAWMEGGVSGFATIKGPLKNIEVDGELRLNDFNYSGSHLGDSRVELRIRDHKLAASAVGLDDRVRGAIKMDTIRLMRYDAELDWTDFDLTPFLPRTILGQTDPIRAEMSGRLDAEGTLRDDFHHAGLELDDLRIHRKDHAIHAGGESPIQLAYTNGALRLHKVHLKSPEGAPGKTDLQLSGFVRPSGPLDIRARGAIDLSFIDFAYDVFDRAEAELFELDLVARGRSTSAIEVEGTAELTDALLKTIYFPHALELSSARVALRDGRVTVDSLEGRLGGGQLEEVTGSYVLLDRSGYRPRSFGLKANCMGCTLRYPDFMPPATGDLRLQFAGTAPHDLLLSGQVDIQEMVLREPLNWQRSILSFRSKFTDSLAEADSRSLFDIDMSFSSVPGAVRIHNNVGDIRGSARNFRIVGDTSHVVLEGDVQIEGGTLPYSGHNFEIEPGTARFRDRESWFPELELRMWTDVENREETYRIAYAISGPLDAPKLQPSAEPQLAEADINLLLLFGLTQEQLAEAELGDVVLAGAGAGLGTLGESTATSLGQSVQGRDVDALIPDRIEIVPVYTDTTGATTVWTVATKEVVPGVLTLEGGFGLGTGRNMSVPTVLRAQVGFRRNVYLEGSWLRDDEASRPYGNFGLDLKFEVDFE